jgi:hypothetical protein
MRAVLGLLVLPWLVWPALAQDAPARRSWEQHFTQADLAHDGHLTRAEAKGGYAAVAKHFDEIDLDHKGYVTTGDIKAWRIMRRAAHRRAKPPADAVAPQQG